MDASRGLLIASGGIMELLTILAADYANITKEGKLNVMGIFKNIYAADFPARHLSMTLVVKLGAELGEFDDERQLTVKLMDEDGNEIMRLTGPVKVPKPSGGHRPEINAILEVNEIVFPHPGRYQFSVQVDKDVKGSYSIDVIKIEQNLSEIKQE
jgi:hypothetical protein